MKNLIIVFKISFIVIVVMVSYIFPSNISSEIEEGKNSFEAKNFDGAKGIFKKVLNENDESAIANYYFARILFEEKNYDEAIDFFKEAVEFDNKNSNYYLWLAKAYTSEINNVSFISKGIYSSKAMSNLEESIKIDPNNIEARQYLAMFLFRAPAIGGGDKDEAWKQADKIFELDKQQGLTIKAQFYQIEEQFDKALEIFNEQIILDPKNVKLYYSVGLIYQSQKSFDKAFESFEKALKIDKTAYASMYQIGRTAVFSSSNLDKGIIALTNYIENAEIKDNLPAIDGAHWRLGSIYKLKGDKVKAREHYEMAIKLNPDNDSYKESLEAMNNEQ